MWIDGDELRLLDDAGEEWTTFGDAEDCFNLQSWELTPCALVKDESDAPDDLRPVRAPVLPPDGVDASAWHILVADDGDLTLTGDGAGDQHPADLDVHDKPAALLDLLRDEADGPVTVTEAHNLATDADDDVLNVSRRTVGNWIDELVEAGALVEGDYRQREGRVYRVR